MTSRSGPRLREGLMSLMRVAFLYPESGKVPLGGNLPRSIEGSPRSKRVATFSGPTVTNFSPIDSGHGADTLSTTTSGILRPGAPSLSRYSRVGQNPPRRNGMAPECIFLGCQWSTCAACRSRSPCNQKLGFEAGDTFSPEGQQEVTWAQLRSGRAELMLARADEPVIPSQQAVRRRDEDGPETSKVWRRRRSVFRSMRRAASFVSRTRMGSF